MENKHSSIDFHKYVDDELGKKGFKIVLADEMFVKARKYELEKFITGVLLEYVDKYHWDMPDENYLMNPMVDKWKYSYAILNMDNRVCFLDFVSVYKDILHQHLIFGDKQSRGMNFGKLNMIKICQNGLDHGFTQIETFVPKKNNGSLMFHMKLGWEIDTFRENTLILMKVDLQKARDISYKLLIAGT